MPALVFRAKNASKTLFKFQSALNQHRKKTKKHIYNLLGNGRPCLSFVFCPCAGLVDLEVQKVSSMMNPHVNGIGEPPKNTVPIAPNDATWRPLMGPSLAQAANFLKFPHGIGIKFKGIKFLLCHDKQRCDSDGTAQTRMYGHGLTCSRPCLKETYTEKTF